MNLKGRNTAAVKTATDSKKEKDEASSETLLDDVFAEIDSETSKIVPEINLEEVDTSDLDLSSEVQGFIETLPTSEECSAKEAKTEVVIENPKPKKATTKRPSSVSNKKADEFRKIRQQNEKEFQEYLEDFQNAVEITDVDEYIVPVNKPFLKTKFEAQGFDVSKVKEGLKVSF